MSEVKERKHPMFPQYQGQRCPPPTERDVEILKSLKRKRESREINRMAEQVLRRQQIRKELEKEGWLDVAKADGENLIDVNETARNILKGRYGKHV